MSRREPEPGEPATAPGAAGPNGAAESVDSPGPAMPTGADEPRWRRVHRITPLLTAWKFAAALFAIVLFQVADDLARAPLPGLTLVGLVAAGIAVGILISLAYSYVAWRRLSYAITDDAVLMRSGVLFRRERASRLTRIQAVEVTQPILGRLFGFAAITIESAGGAEANLRLAYLTHDEARAVRNEILARAAGLDVSVPVADDLGDGGDGGGPEGGGDGSGGGLGDDDLVVARASGGGGARRLAAGGREAPVRVALAPEAPEREVLSVPPGRLVGSLALNGLTLAFVVFAGVLTGFAISLRSTEFLFGWLFGLLGVLSYLWSRFSREFGFRLAVSPDGLRVRSGLLETRAQTIPPGRIQGIGIAQGPLWRTRGWWRVSLSLATGGTGSESGDASAVLPDVLLPVGGREEVLRVVRLALPGITDDDAQTLVTGMVGSGSDDGWTISPRRARWVDPLAWRRNGFRVVPSLLAIRRGRIYRQLDLVPHERTQSLGISQGPLERRLRLVSFHAHSSGDLEPTLPHVDPAVAADLLAEQSERARAARRSAGPERWMLPTP